MKGAGFVTEGGGSGAVTRKPEQIFRGCWTLLKRWMGDDGSKTGRGGGGVWQVAAEDWR